MPETIPNPPSDPKLRTIGPLAFLPEMESAELLGKCRAIRMQPGEQLVCQGSFPAEILIAVDGRLKRVNESGESAGVAEAVEPYQPIGIDCLMSGAAYPYSIYAEQETTVRIIPWKELKPLIDRIPGLGGYLRVISESSVVREMDMTLDEMGCSPSFRCALLGALQFESLPPETWLVREGETPSFIYYSVLGEVQAYAKAGDGSLRALWIAPNFTWQLFDLCLGKAPVSHYLKAVSKVLLYKLPLRAIEALKEKSPEDFSAFAKVATPVLAEKAEEEEEGGELESLQELFPAPPKPAAPWRFSYPFVQQNDEMDCGPACMAMVAQYYGNDLPVQFWRARMGTNQEGTSLFDLAKAAEKVGFVSHGLEITDLLRVEKHLLPLIALRKYHYSVVYRADKGGALVGDPAIGVRKIPWAEFKEGFDGYVLILKPTEQFYQVKAPQRGYRHYLDIFRGQAFELWLILAASLMLTVLGMVPAFLSQFILDQVLAKKDPQLLVLAIAGAMVVTGMMGILSWLRGYYVSFLTARFDFAAVSAFMRKLFSLPFDFFATRHVGDFTRRLAELERIREFVMTRLIETLLHFLNVGVFGVALFMYSPQVALAVYLSAPFLVGCSALFSRRLAALYSQVFSLRSEQDGLISDLIKGMSTIKTLGAEVASRWRYEEALVKTLSARYDASITAATLGAGAEFMNQLISFSVIGLAAYMAIRGQMSPGQVVSVSVLAAGVINPFNGLAGLWAEIQEMRTVLDRLNDVFLAESETRPDKRSLIKERVRGEIEFRDVWFRYGGESSEWALKGVTFRILPGQSVAIVGASGAGKSTLALLTARLYEPTKGIILIDGRDYREYDRQWLRRQIGLLLQETSLFHGSILDNIAYGDPRPDLARVEAASETADAKDFIYEKSSGYDYLITHGGLGLSGGQKARIAIARILYENPAILFLDEATSALDANSERTIVSALQQARKNRTVISIAHRYNTVKMSDFAMVIDAGKVVEFGQHKELLALGGYYAKLFSDQIG